MKILTTTVLSFSMLISLFAHSQEYGKASYIDLAYQGGKTASGETYDGNQFTAAHKVHPFGTRIKVTRQDNGRSVIVRVNDRGPYIKGRIIDLSYAAAKALDMIRDGVVDVNIEVVSTGTPNTSGNVSASGKLPTQASVDPAPAQASVSNNTAASNSTSTNTPNTANSGTVNGTQADPTSNTPPVTQNSTTDYGDRLLTQNYEKFGLYEIKILQVNKAGFGVQIASLSSYENAMKQLTQLQAKKINNALLSIEPKEFGGMAFKVIVGPYADKAEAKKQLANLKRLLKVNGFVVDLSTISY